MKDYSREGTSIKLFFLKVGQFFLSSLFFISFFPNRAQSADGVYVAGQGASHKSNPVLEQYVQQVVINNLIKTYGEIFNRTIKQNKLSILPQMAYLAAQQATSESLKQPNLHEIIQQAYDEGLKVANEEKDKGTQSRLIERMVLESVKHELRRMTDLLEFRYLTEEMLRQAVVKQQQILIGYAYQQQIQKLLIEQQIMSQALQKQYEQSVARSILK